VKNFTSIPFTKTLVVTTRMAGEKKATQSAVLRQHTVDKALKVTVQKRFPHFFA
jgi:hypothetical protein